MRLGAQRQYRAPHLVALQVAALDELVGCGRSQLVATPKLKSVARDGAQFSLNVMNRVLDT